MESSGTMKAMASDGYGPLERTKCMELPALSPGPGEVRVRVHASSLNPADHKVILGTMKFLHARNKPLVVGYDHSGTIEALGAGVTGYSEGQEVFGFLPYGPFNKQGAFAETLIAKVGEFAVKPSSVSHDQAAAAATSGVSALQALRDLGRLRAGQRALITGVSGGVGSLAVGIAKRLGASVTAIGSGAGLDIATSMGADEVIDRKAAPVLDQLKGPYDIIFDAAAAYRWRDMKGLLNKGGAFVTTLPSMGFALDKLASLMSPTRVHFLNVKGKAADLALLGKWLSDGLKVHVDHTVGVKDLVPSLMNLEKGGVKGKVVVAVKDRF